MDPRESADILRQAGEIGASLHRGSINLENMILETDKELEKMREIRTRLKTIRQGVVYHYDEHGMNAEDFLLTMGNTLLPLGKTICLLEAKKECLELCLRSMNNCVRAGNSFANKLAAIPKKE